MIVDRKRDLLGLDYFLHNVVGGLPCFALGWSYPALDRSLVTVV